MRKIFSILILVSIWFNGNSQEAKTKLHATLCDGFIMAGYVNEGAYLNFGGPALKLTHKPFSFILGMLPSLRFKEDNNGVTKNSFITPTLGTGLTIVYKHLALQAPLYYNSKTSAANGKWHAGVGLGYKF